MKPGDRVWVKSGPMQGWAGHLREIGPQVALVDWDGRGVKGAKGYVPAEPDILLAALEPEVWLRLTCCPVGEMITVCWLYPNSQKGWVEEVFGFFPKGAKDIPPWSPDDDKLKTGKADWVLARPRELFGSDKLAVRVRFCPGCGVKTPNLRVRKGPTSFHRVEADDGGTCLTCQVRYCSGEDPSRVFEIDPT